MKSKNTITNFFIVLALFTMTFAITGFNFNNFSFKGNEKAYFFFLACIISVSIAIFRVKKENEKL